MCDEQRADELTLSEQIGRHPIGPSGHQTLAGPADRGFLCPEQTAAKEGDMKNSIYENVVLVTILLVVGLSYVSALSGTISIA